MNSPVSSAKSGAWQVGIDIGGTFTDVVAFQPSTGEIA